MKKLQKDCLYCRNKINKKTSCSMNNWIDVVKYCSKKCYAMSMNSRVVIICINCKNEFKVTNNRKNVAKFCSSKCMNKFSIGENSHHWKGGLIDIKCLTCKSFFTDAPSNKRKFCSRKCYEMWKSDATKGAKNPWWKGGITPIALQIRHSPKYKLWRTSVFTRDNWTCQKCKQKGIRLRADHIYPFSIILRENNIKNLEDGLSCINLWNLDNGRTLCVPCDLKIGWKGSHLKK